MESLDKWESVVLNMQEIFDIPPAYQPKEFNEVTNLLKLRIQKITKQNPGSSEQSGFLKHLLNNIKALANDYFYNKTNLKTAKEWKAKDSNVRDSLMASNLLFWANKYPDAKIVCWGANVHFANKVFQLNNEELKDFTPMGSHLKNVLKEDIYIIGSTCSKGEYSHYTGEILKLESDSGSIENNLSRKEFDFAFIDLSKNSKANYFSSHSLEFEEGAVYGNWNNVYDALLYVKEATPVSINDNNDFEFEDNSNTDNYNPNAINFKSNTKTIKQIKSTQGLYKKIQGSIVSSETNEPVPFASLSFQNTSIGTVSNQNGDFVLNYQKDLSSDSITVSSIGYLNKNISLSSLTKTNIIKLTPAIYSIPEVTVEGKAGFTKILMKKVIENFSKNYNPNPFMYKAFGRGVYIPEENPDKIFLREAIYNIINKNGSSANNYDRIFQLIMARKTAYDSTTNKRDYQYFNELFWGSTRTDPIYSSVQLIHKINSSKYSIKLKEIIERENDSIYIIEFNCNKPKYNTTGMWILKSKSFHGKFYVNSTDYAIIQFEINGKGLFSTSIFSVFSYSKYDNYYYLSHLYSKEKAWFPAKGLGEGLEDGEYDNEIEIFTLEISENVQENPIEIRQIETIGNYNVPDWENINFPIFYYKNDPNLNKTKTKCPR